MGSFLLSNGKPYLTTVESAVGTAYGRTFNTSYDADGKILPVSETSPANQTLATYTYENSGITNGAPTGIVDGLSGVSQTLTYWGLNNGGATD